MYAMYATYAMYAMHAMLCMLCMLCYAMLCMICIQGIPVLFTTRKRHAGERTGPLRGSGEARKSMLRVLVARVVRLNVRNVENPTFFAGF